MQNLKTFLPSTSFSKFFPYETVRTVFALVSCLLLFFLKIKNKCYEKTIICYSPRNPLFSYFLQQ